MFMYSIVVPAFNEEKNIGACLQGLVDQKTDKEFEVILVNNNCTDNTIAEAQKFSDRLNLHIVEEPRKGRSPARRKGFEVAQGEIVISTDADAVAPDNWVGTLLTFFEDEKTVAVGGTCFIDDCGWLKNLTYNIGQPLAMHVYRIMYGHYWLSGFSFAIRKSIYEEAGGFDPDLNALEDIDLGFRVAKQGKIRFSNKAPTKFSSRRFDDGFISGLVQYLKPFRHYRKGDYSKTTLSDPR